MGFLSTLHANPQDKTQIHIVHSVSNGALFYNYEPLFLCDIDSHSNKGDLRRMLTQAAFTVRFMNHTLNRTEYTLPVFWISDSMIGSCYLVFQDKENVRFVIIFTENQEADMLVR